MDDRYPAASTGAHVNGPFLTEEMRAGMARMLQERAEADPEFAEDVESLMESKDYLVYPGPGRPEKCEVCGTLVAVWSEVPLSSRGEREPALWEPEAGRKHTPRRCGWKREHPAQADAVDPCDVR